MVAMIAQSFKRHKFGIVLFYIISCYRALEFIHVFLAEICRGEQDLAVAASMLIYTSDYGFLKSKLFSPLVRHTVTALFSPLSFKPPLYYVPLSSKNLK